MDIRRVVGRNVRRYRIETKLSQEGLAACIGVEQGYVSRLEAGKRNPTIVTIWHAAEALGVRPAALFRTRAPTAKRKKPQKPVIQI
jgi:transcriptional regulator with XRE-family HTH domain